MILKALESFFQYPFVPGAFFLTFKLPQIFPFKSLHPLKSSKTSKCLLKTFFPPFPRLLVSHQPRSRQPWSSHVTTQRHETLAEGLLPWRLDLHSKLLSVYYQIVIFCGCRLVHVTSDTGSFSKRNEKLFRLSLGSGEWQGALGRFIKRALRADDGGHRGGHFCSPLLAPQKYVGGHPTDFSHSHEALGAGAVPEDPRRLIKICYPFGSSYPTEILISRLIHVVKLFRNTVIRLWRRSLCAFFFVRKEAKSSCATFIVWK